MGRYIRYWYTYRTVVAVLLALILSGVMFWLYTQQVACDTQAGGCYVNLSVHPEDRLVGQSNPDPNVVIVGIDNQSVKEIGVYPVTRDRYATALRNLQKLGAAVVAFDIGFPDARDPATDLPFHDALAEATIPVILAYGAEVTDTSDGKIVQSKEGIDQIPHHNFRCIDINTDPNAPCQRPDPNVQLASTTVKPDKDGVLRRIPMFVEPLCTSAGSCKIQTLNPLGFAAYRAYALGKDFQTGPQLEESNGNAMFGTAWKDPLPVDPTGSAIINYFGPPENYKSHHQYISFADVWKDRVSRDQVDGKIVLVGYYGLTGVNDYVLATTSAGAGGAQMAGVEMHANVVQMLLQTKFLNTESPLVVFLIILVVTVLMAVVVARVPVVWGLIATVGALIVLTVGLVFVATNGSLVPDVFHPWLAIGLTYTGITAYRFLYEDRERRKVQSLFGVYLKPEIVAQLAKTRGGVEDIMRGGERRDITLLFVDVRGFTSMSESMSAHDVAEVVQMYLDHLSGIIFTWDGTIDKYVGDEIVAFWNAPRLQENHALLAVRCAYDLINKAPELQERLLAKGLPPIRWGIGVNTGPAVVGNLGSRSRIQYTALGDTVNTAARFCANAPAYHLLIGQPTYDACKDYIAVDMVPGVQLKGKSAETFRIYQVTAIRETPTSPWVMFPTEMATQAHQVFKQQYTQQTVIAAGETGSKDILIGTAAEEVLAAQPAAPAAVAPAPEWPSPPTDRSGS